MKRPVKERSAAVWGASPAGSAHAPDAAPGTRAFFERVLERRNGREIRWLRELIPFASYRDKLVLEVGCGAGYDAWEFCRAGARYVGVDLTPANPPLARRHLALFGFAPILARADAERLPFRDGVFTLVFSNGVLHHTPDLGRSLGEAWRVLQPGGELRVAVYHRDSAFYWLKIVLTDHFFRLGFLRRSLRERLAMVEFTTSGELPLVRVYGRRRFRSLVTAAGFRVVSVRVRKLLAEDLPDLPLLWRFWPRLPERWLEAAGRVAGWYLIVHAVKPESGA